LKVPGPGTGNSLWSWKLKLKVLESPEKISLKITHLFIGSNGNHFLLALVAYYWLLNLWCQYVM